MKDESYTGFKHGRGIYSRDDVFKCLFGPIVASIEKRVYSHKSFVKHVPVRDRPKYIEELFSFYSDNVAETDYTSFEASFTAGTMAVTSGLMYKFFLQHLDSSYLDELVQIPTGLNKCVFKWFTVWIRARRMSGEMDTSLSNGFANLMVMSFLAWEKGERNLAMAVEGDDGLTKGNFLKRLTEDDFRSLGFKVKLEKKDDISSASFCGIIYDPDELINVTNPKEVLAGFGWASGRYARYGKKKLMALLRCKSLSYLYQYPGCPIIQELALFGLRVTRSFDVKSMYEDNNILSQWERGQIKEAVEFFKNHPGFWKEVKEVGPKTRLLVERQFGISVKQQVAIEAQLASLETLQELSIDLDFPIDWLIYERLYVFETDTPFMTMQCNSQFYNKIALGGAT